jgi:hypothetical protein
MVGFGALHDPEGRLLEISQKYLPEISNLFSGLVIAVSPQTKTEYNDIQGKGNIAFYTCGNVDDFTLRRKTALEKALVQFPDTAYWAFDLDKLLHWYLTLPSELEGLVVMGRSQKAWNTYPKSWQDTESIVNYLAVKVFKKDGWDFYSGQFYMDRNMAEIISSHSLEADFSQNMEWIQLAYISSKLNYHAYDGLSWEDPDRFQAEIKNLGYTKWYDQTYDNFNEWQKRIHNLIVAVNYLEKIASK